MNQGDTSQETLATDVCNLRAQCHVCSTIVTVCRDGDVWHMAAHTAGRTRTPCPATDEDVGRSIEHWLKHITRMASREEKHATHHQAKANTLREQHVAFTALLANEVSGAQKLNCAGHARKRAGGGKGGGR